MMMTAILSVFSSMKKMMSFKAICGLAVAISIAFNIFLWKTNKKLSAGLETAQNNIESYEGILSNNIEKNRTLTYTV